MSGGIDPEAARPTTTQAFEQSDRNPVVTSLGGADAEGGPIPVPESSASRVTAPGPAVSPNAGLQDYDTADSADDVQGEAEREKNSLPVV
jgi:hypothetical protein